MPIYKEFIPPIKEFIRLITSRQFDKVFYGDGQPIAEGLRQLIVMLSDPVEIGGSGVSFEDPDDSDFDDVILSRIDSKAPPLLDPHSDDGEYMGWYFDNDDYPSYEDLPPLQLSLPSSVWGIDEIKIRMKPSGHLRLDIFLRIDNDHMTVSLIEIRY